jgi:hypothetical protein
MTPKRLLLVLVVAAGLAGVAYVSQEADTPGNRMAAAADAFVQGLSAEQKAKATFEFDDKDRTNWHFVPYQDKQKKPLRKGLRLAEMTEPQKKAALALVKAGTSPDGYTKATTIMSLESILHDLEKSGSIVRDPDWYFFSVFGKPARAGKWGWRVEGHHLSLNFTLEGSKVIGATPFFFGANPAEVKAGDRKGLRTLPEAEDHARALFDSLDEEQKKVAFQAKQFKEIEEGKPAPNVGEPVGLPAARMTDKQRDTLNKLLNGYADRMPPGVAAVELARVKEAGIEKVHFAFARDDEKPGKPYTYHVQGPTFVIEFLNVQSDSAGNPANHIHSAWRNLKGDFGLATN